MSDVGTVLIVGGGIAGLTLATALRRYGFSAEVVERRAEWHTAGAGLSVANLSDLYPGALRHEASKVLVRATVSPIHPCANAGTGVAWSG